MMMTETNMREVVERLRSERCEVMLELSDFDRALAALLQSVESVAASVQDVRLVASKVVDLRDGNALAWMAVRDQTIHLDVWVGEFLAAFREFRGAVQEWNIGGQGAGANPPVSEKRPMASD